MEMIKSIAENLLGIAMLLLMLGVGIGWLIGLFTGSGESTSDLDTKDPGDWY